LLFIGPAPSLSGDVLGKALTGPEDRLLKQALEDASRKAGWTPTYYITNLVACRSWDPESRHDRDPAEDEIIACRSRLMSLVARVRPERIILLGPVAQQEGVKIFPDATGIPHPEGIIYSGGALHSALITVAYQRFWMSLWGIIKKIKKEGE